MLELLVVTPRYTWSVRPLSAFSATISNAAPNNSHINTIHPPPFLSLKIFLCKYCHWNFYFTHFTISYLHNMLRDLYSLLWELVALIGATGMLYIGVLTIYRLTLHPLAAFPGPKIAAVTRLYEAYWDVVQNGQYTFQIGRLQKKYGKYILYSAT